MDVAPKWPTSPEYYNSVIIVDKDGETIANYRKTFLYYTDETWALEGEGFFGYHIPELDKIATMGICRSYSLTPCVSHDCLTRNSGMDIKFALPPKNVRLRTN